MDHERFETLTRRFAAASTRREAAAALAGGAAAAVLTVLRPGDARAGEVDPQSALIPGCKIPGQKCNNKNDCCGDGARCRKGRCQCIERGGSPLVQLSPQLPPIPLKALCCSDRIRKRTGRCL